MKDRLKQFSSKLGSTIQGGGLKRVRSVEGLLREDVVAQQDREIERLK